MTAIDVGTTRCTTYAPCERPECGSCNPSTPTVPQQRQPNPTGDQVLTEVYQFLGRFVAYPTVHAHIAHTLWVAHTHMMSAWDSTPRIAFLSPEPGSGKSRCLEASELLVPNPMMVVNVSTPYVIRKISDEAGAPTVLYDEIDTVFGPKAKEHEDIRGVLNAGHRRGAVAGRCSVIGKTVVTEELPAYAAVAMAGLGDLPDTLLSRAVVIRMRKRAPDERVEPFRRRQQVVTGHGIRDRLAGWAERTVESVTDAWPDLPDGIEDRDADVWEALVAVADAAGGHWPQAARAAAVALVGEAHDTTPSLGVRLLADLKTVFGDGTDRMFTDDILKHLCGLLESPWGDLKGAPITTRTLARLLGQYGVKSRDVKISGVTRKGYRREDLYDPWKRYVTAAEDGQR